MLNNIILHPTYFPNVSHAICIAKFNTVIWEICDNYQKQTLRNRTYIYTANGKLALTIPVIYTQKNRQLYKDVQIDNSTNWQMHHWKSLVSAYNASPFFEFYKDDLHLLYNTKTKFILDFNFKCFNFLNESIDFNTQFQKTKTFKKTIKNDFRHLVNPKTKTTNQKPYNQVFTTKHGFIENLSCLDLLFNEGTNTENYLNSH